MEEAMVYPLHAQRSKEPRSEANKTKDYPVIGGSRELIIGHVFRPDTAAGEVLLDRARALIGSAIKNYAGCLFPGSRSRQSARPAGVT